MTDHSPSQHPKIPTPKIGVLLINLGTPATPTAKDVRRYLAEFLSDERVVDLPRWLWLTILHGVILNIRPSRSAKAYNKIWFHDAPNGDDIPNWQAESPLRYYTRKQTDRLRHAFHIGAEDNPNIIIDWAMRYGDPSIPDQLSALKKQGCNRILCVPLYPQYSATTTASVMDKIGQSLSKMRWQPTIRIAPPFHDMGRYIEGLRMTTTRSLAALSQKPDRVLISFHGIPERYFTSGDPYPCHCEKTARLLRDAMGWSEEYAPLVYQSKFGREKWLEPSAKKSVEQFGINGDKNIAVITPAFVSDCIETLEEISMELKESFVEAGGEDLTLIPCLNDSDEMIRILKDICDTELAGWVS